MSCGELGPIEGGLIKDSTIQNSTITGSEFTGGEVRASDITASNLKNLASCDPASARTVAHAVGSDAPASRAVASSEERRAGKACRSRGSPAHFA